MGDKKTVLVVEDNDFVRAQIVGYLGDAGHAPLEAREGSAALDILHGDPAVDLAIVDVRMEPMGGFEFIRELRGQDNHTPVILVTGDQTSDVLEQSGKLGVGAVLMKPVEKERLLKSVERAMKTGRRP